MEESIERFRQLFYADELANAAELLTSIKPQLTELTPEMQKLEEDLEYIEYAKELFACTAWHPVKDSDGIAVFYKGADTELICKITTTIDAPLLHVLSVVAEVQLLHNWVETATQYTTLSEPTHFRKLLHYNIWFPWPFKDRSCFMECVAVPNKEQKAALIVLRTPKVETRQNIIPTRLINYAMKTIMHPMIAKYRRQVMNFRGSDYEAATEEKREFYDHISRLILEYLANS